MSSTIIYYSPELNSLIYLVNGTYYLGGNRIAKANVPKDMYRVLSISPDFNPPTQPFLLLTATGWVIISYNTEKQMPIIMDQSSEDTLTQPILRYFELRIPYTNAQPSTSLRIINLRQPIPIHNRLSLLNNYIGKITPRIFFDILYNNINMIYFRDVAVLLTNNQIVDYTINPNLQILATPGNVIMTFTSTDGKNYISEVRYDDVSKQIFPPI